MPIETSTMPVASLGATRVVTTTAAPGSGAAGEALIATDDDDLAISKLVNADEAANGPVPPKLPRTS